MIIKPTSDLTLPWVDFSSLTAVNTCPRWGIIHSIHGKRLSAGVDRVLPLEAGRAMHDVFACCRFFDLMTATDADGDVGDRVTEYADKLFKNAEHPDRWHLALKYFFGSEDAETRCMQMCLNLLETSGYYDDPRDNKRTMTNLETAAINYIQRYPLGRFIPIMTDKVIGIEVPIDVTVYSLEDVPLVRIIGRVDGVCIDTLRPNDPVPEVHENKTGSRIDTVWSSSFDTSHQVTTYCVAMSCILGIQITNCVMWGLQIPVPKSSMYSDGIMRYPTARNSEAVVEWAEWIMHTLNVIDQYKDDPTNAPMYTHSCNRYFRSCSFIPLCVESREQRKHIYEHEMTVDRWSPLADSIGE